MIDSIYWIWEETLLNSSMPFENLLGVLFLEVNSSTLELR